MIQKKRNNSQSIWVDRDSVIISAEEYQELIELKRKVYDLERKVYKVYDLEEENSYLRQMAYPDPSSGDVCPLGDYLDKSH